MTSRSIAQCGLCCALLACSAWVTIPFGPVPFTLQTLAVALVPQVLARREAVFTVAAYLVLGAIGLPVFSGFQGGIGVLAGPTGGFLWGFLVGMVPAAAITGTSRIPRPVAAGLGCAVLLLVSYVLGTLQIMAVGGMELPAALAVAVLPFVVPDIVKLIVACALARAVNRALAASNVARS